MGRIFLVLVVFLGACLRPPANLAGRFDPEIDNLLQERQPQTARLVLVTSRRDIAPPLTLGAGPDDPDRRVSSIIPSIRFIRPRSSTMS